MDCNFFAKKKKQVSTKDMDTHSFVKWGLRSLNLLSLYERGVITQYVFSFWKIGEHFIETSVNKAEIESVFFYFRQFKA